MRNGRRQVRPERSVRRERSTAAVPPVVAVTGAARGVGHALVTRLAGSRPLSAASSRSTITAATPPGSRGGSPTSGTPRWPRGSRTWTWWCTPTWTPSADSDPRERRARNVRGAQTVLTAAAAERVGRVVLVTSAMVYGARPDNPVPLPEDAPLLADSGGSLAGDLLEIEELARRSRRVNPGTSVTVVRPAALVGDAVDTLLTRHFEAPRLLVVRGCAPRWQFCHVDDLAAALELAATGVVDGDFAVGCDGSLSQAEVESLSGLKSLELPARLTFSTAQRLHRLGVIPSPSAELRYVVYPWVVECAALRAAGLAACVLERRGAVGAARGPGRASRGGRAAASRARTRRSPRRGPRGPPPRSSARPRSSGTHGRRQARNEEQGLEWQSGRTRLTGNLI